MREESIAQSGEPLSRARPGADRREARSQLVRRGDRRRPAPDLERGAARYGGIATRIRECENPPHLADMFAQAVGGHRAELPNTPLPNATVQSVRSVLDQHETVSPALLLQQVHAIRDAVQVRRQDGVQLSPCRIVECRWVDIPGCGIERRNDWD
ncbi:MAG TPA: hypothetical protein VGQ48_12960 [Gemmatimonadales bacterium]|jgi:hypothetical protein|nr:hypothetical protein [Gemmatimonadales bacterium]